MKQRSISTPMVIHLFAAAHALIACMSRLVNHVDDLPLTVLTISLIVIISLRYRLQAEMIAVLTFIGTFAGYLLGGYGAMLITHLVSDPIIASTITTTLYTELLGWGVYTFARLRQHAQKRPMGWTPPMAQLLMLVSLVLLFRISYTLIFSSDYFAQTSIHVEFQRLLSNMTAILALLCGNLFMVSARRPYPERIEWRVLLTALLIVVYSVLLTLMVYYDFPRGNGLYFAWLPFLRLFSVVLLCDIAVFAVMKLLAYALVSKAELNTERGKKHLAQFRYNKLKMQINPHFLFNSLNILDYLVQEQENERAGAFIRKLSECYRYMLKTEDEQLVPLSEEVEFARKYIDLLQERFTDGFVVRFDIEEEALDKFVIPCALQLLIENATKHNIVSHEQPLVVTIRNEGDTLLVENNLQLRLSRQASTGKGLKNIRDQYLDLSDRTIQIEQTDTHFTVKIPLI